MAVAPASAPITVRILDRDYRLACAPAERDALLAAAAHVDARMLAIREQGRVAGVERVAVLAALEIASELLADRPLAPPPTAPEAPVATSSSLDRTVVVDSEMMRRMQSINALLDTAFVGQERLF